MTDVKSKNLYELLGNTSDQDSDREPDPPTKAVDRPAARSGKRDAPKSAPAAPAAPVATEAPSGRGGRGGRGEFGGRGDRGDRRRGGFSGSEAAFRDRATGRNYNRDKPIEGDETGVRTGRDSGPGTQRGGRGPRGPRRGGDRHSRTGIGEHPKQEGQGWGQQTGEGEWADERAGEAIATQEAKEGEPAKPEVFDANAEPAAIPENGEADDAEAEPEDKNKSYADYLAEQAAKRLEHLGLKEARAPNEGDKKKWTKGTEIEGKHEETAYFPGQEKNRRERGPRSAKEFVEIDYSFKESTRDTRGGRGGRGGRGRGEGRGEYRGRGSRGEFGSRGDFGGRGRGDRERGDRGDRAERGERGGRGGRRGDSSTPAINDDSAFPSLGSK